MNVFLARHIAHDAVRAVLFRNGCHRMRRAGDEGDASAAAAELAHERKAEPGGAASDRYLEINHGTQATSSS